MIVGHSSAPHPLGDRSAIARDALGEIAQNLASASDDCVVVGRAEEARALARIARRIAIMASNTDVSG